MTSGYSTSVTAEAFDAFIDANADLIQAGRKGMANKLLVYLEEGHMWGDEKRRRKAVTEKIYPLVDSVGMNEEEMADLANFLGLNPAKPEIEILKEIGLRFGIDRVCMHGSRKVVTVTKSDPDRERLALALGVLFSAARGFYGRFVAAADIFALPERLGDLTKSKTILPVFGAGHGYSVVEMPTLFGMPLRSSLGLGDAFTGGVIGML